MFQEKNLYDGKSSLFDVQSAITMANCGKYLQKRGSLKSYSKGVDLNLSFAKSMYNKSFYSIWPQFEDARSDS
jgi:hypothetical protein